MDQELNGKKIAVIGLGVSNLSVLNYLKKHDLKQLTVYDTRTNPPHVGDLPMGIDLRLGPLNTEELSTLWQDCSFPSTTLQNASKRPLLSLAVTL